MNFSKNNQSFYIVQISSTNSTQLYEVPEHFPGNKCPITKACLPELGGIALGDTELIAGVETLRKDRLQLTEHVTEDQAELGQVAPVVGVLVEQALLPLLEELNGLLALLLQVLDENFEVFITI